MTHQTTMNSQEVAKVLLVRSKIENPEVVKAGAKVERTTLPRGRMAKLNSKAVDLNPVVVDDRVAVLGLGIRPVEARLVLPKQEMPLLKRRVSLLMQSYLQRVEAAEVDAMPRKAINQVTRTELSLTCQYVTKLDGRFTCLHER